VLKYPDSFVSIVSNTRIKFVKYDLILRYEARVNALRASSYSYLVEIISQTVKNCFTLSTERKNPGKFLRIR